MTRWSGVVVFFLFAVGFTPAGASGRHDFSGTWELDVAESAEIQAGAQQPRVTMVISQTKDRLTISQTVHSPSGDQKDEYTYVPDGRSRTVEAFGRKRVAVVRWEGDKLAATIRQESPQGVTPAESQLKETWELSERGNTLYLHWESLDEPPTFKTSRFVFRLSSFKTK